MNYENFLLNLIKEDDRLVVITAENRAAIRNLPDIVSDRFIDVGIAEQTMAPFHLEKSQFLTCSWLSNSYTGTCNM